MLTKQQIVSLMINDPEDTGRYFFRVGNRIIFTVSREMVERAPNRRSRRPSKRKIQHRSFLMPAEAPAVSDPSLEGWYFDRVCEEIAEKAITHTMRGHWQKKVAQEFGLDPSLITCEGYKVVAVKDDKYLSLYDGVTQYKIGERLEQAAKSGHKGGYYVMYNIHDCNGGDIPLPTNAVLRRWPHRAILRVEFGGKVVLYKKKVAASWIRPLYVVKTIC